MAVFAVSFRISSKTTVIGSYDERYQSVDAAVRDCTTGRCWSETPSFYLIESDGTSADLARAIDKASALDHGVDLLVCINLSTKGYKVIGDYSDINIEAILAIR